MLSKIYCLNHFAYLKNIGFLSKQLYIQCHYTKFTVLFVTNKNLMKFYELKDVEINYRRNNKL